jgi:hypothetical protein
MTDKRTTAAELMELTKALDYIERTKNGNLLDLVMPNGKRLRDCTGLECRETGEWLNRMGERLDALKSKAGL